VTNYQPYNVYKPRPQQPPPRKRSLSLKKATWLGLGLFIVITGLRVDLAQQANARATAAAETARRLTAVKALTGQLKAVADANPQIDFSVATTDVISGQSAGYQAYLPVDAASTAKLISAALYLNETEKGQRGLNQAIGDYSAKQALQLLVQQSDDTIWAQLNELLGHGALQAYAEGLGLTTYDADNNQISAQDMDKFLLQLEQDNLLSQAHTDLLLSFMQHTNYEDFISPVAQGKVFYHKVGIDGDQVNDVAIIRGHNDTLIISVMTNGNGTYDWPARAQLIQKITRLAEQAYLN